MSDGSPTGTTELVKDILPGDGTSSVFDFFALNNNLYFSARNENTYPATVMYTTDGTEENTVPTGVTHAALNPLQYGDLIYYVASNNLYSYDGSTSTLIDATVTVGGGIFTVFKDKLFLYMKTADATTGSELYSYDVTNGFVPIKDVDEGTGSSSISYFAVVGDKLYFEADNYLWETDGTTDGTVAVSSASTIGGVKYLYAWNGKLYFEGDDGSKDQLWVFDPTGEGSVTNISMLKDDLDADVDHNPIHFAAIGDYLYYAADDADASSTDDLLYRTDGTNIELVESTITKIDDIVVMNDVLYFEGYAAAKGNELYKFDPLTLDVADAAYASSLSIYPNPTEGTINIAGLESVDTEYVVFDISGRTVQAGVVAGQSIDLDVEAGIYMLQLVDNGIKLVHKIQVK
ncbi:T9SS type A sorting domain-containing protein [Saccharicrinis sp. GN24d3]|uniref:T9SS type A sorting domain-containing protein n=1 Tax=Saccharicrinis sp. GN24d3 TaxID=3458416 RepID=UPI004035524E